MIIRALSAFFAFVALALIVTSCARQSSPTGGPKDTIPPVLINSIPGPNQTNFKDKTIELEFDEMIIVTNPKEQIIIAPTSNNTYEVTARKRSILLKFDEPLQDSVTYSINFRDAVQDITEKNPVKNLQLAFSTGSYIDSLTISGQVLYQLTGAIPKEATVAIHQANDTLSIFKHKPNYLTKTDNKGFFQLKNLKPGRYTIYAIDDRNRNLVADTRNEYYAFKTNTLVLPQDSTPITLGLVKLDARPLKITSARPYGNYFNIKTGKNLDRFITKLAESPDTVISSFGEDRANIRIYDTFDADSVLVNFTAIDSLGQQLDSGIYVKFNTRETKPDKYTVSQDKATLLEERGDLDITFKFNKPTFSFNQDSLLFVIDSTRVIPLSTGTFSWNRQTNELRITKKIDPALLKPTPAPKPGDLKNNIERQPKATGTEKPKPILKNQLIVGKGTFISIDQDTAPKIQKEIRPVKTEDLGIILAEVRTTAPHFILQLLDKDYHILRETVDNKKIRWDNLPSSDYRIRLVIDTNQNRKWDPGNYLKKEEPEQVFFYLNEKSNPPNTTHLKANWEVGPLLITSE